MGEDDTQNNDLSPSYVGADSFLNGARKPRDQLTDDVDIGVLGVPFDGAASRQPGTRYGPEALRRESGWYGRSEPQYNAATGRTVDYSSIQIQDCGDVPVVTTDVEQTGDYIRDAVETVATHTFPVVLGGDHYLTYPSFTGFSETVDGRVGLIHLDSHSDVYGERDLHGEHWHGSPMNLIADSPHGSYETHAMIGLRAFEDPDFPSFVDESGLYVDYARDVHDRGIEACLADAIDHVTASCDVVYLTVDIDVAEPTIAPGTGTPEFGGLDANQFLTALEYLGTCDAIGALDLVEVAPRLDPTRNTQRLGAAAVSRFIESKFM
ncbi:Arginase/agmatinase/formiminoglutamase [Natrialba chahannaoensis JCM 10990]|uniref:Arginase/agmatinase/formiminoglutamase n=1 Tax=Natrialba chahannaoensis JCM 10990 TaxID=1227492 RepID=M0B1U6_9EURY|nr:agmatinase family protein [Natrialba chahannaoensis]ELZ04760.1 Arginase/agmatinase/formiminoglutamase [Natrialba chahannaoensis JCM 10990]